MLCDQFPYAVLDTCLKAYPKSKVACETAAEDNMTMAAGEITTQAKIDYDLFVRRGGGIDWFRFIRD